MITIEYIQQKYNEIFAEVTAQFSLTTWAVKPSGVELTTHKSAYGYATAKGVVQINKAFLGTKAFTKLSQTLRHEFAHLAIGLEQNHNRQFRRVEGYFGVDVGQDLDDEIKMVLSNISFKYQVVVHLVDGRTVSIGGVHRKTKKYSEYNTETVPSMRCENVKIERFEYIS